MRQIFFDTETTGLSPQDGHRIIEIACLEVIDRKVTGNHYHCYLNPEREIDEAATRVHNITIDQLKDEPLFSEIADDFLAFIGDAELIAHNAPFDMGFLDAELRRMGQPLLSQSHTVTDTLAMARARYPAGRCSLDDLCNRFEIDRSTRRFHGALIDTELLVQVYLAMTRGQETLAIAEHGALHSMLARKTGERAKPKAVQCTEEDRQNHHDYMSKLAKTLPPDRKIFWLTGL